MNIESVATWFFESLTQKYPDELSIILVEGIKSANPEMVEIDAENSLGPYYPVKVLSNSACIEINFSEVLSYQVVNESYSAPQTEMKSADLLGPIQKCSKLEYLQYLESDSLITQTREGEYSSYYIWTEDQAFFVIASKEPGVKSLTKSPDLTIERAKTYFAK